MTEKQIIEANMVGCNNLKEVAAKCQFSLVTLHNKMALFGIKHDFKKGFKKGNSRKVAKLG